MMQKMINEMLKEISQVKEKSEKIRLLRKYDCPGLREVLRYALDSRLEFFTSTIPSYKLDSKTPIGHSWNTLFNESKRFYIFTKPEIEFQLVQKTTTPKRKSEILVQMLENIHPDEAKIMECMITKDFTKRYNINKKLVEEAYPNMKIG